MSGNCFELTVGLDRYGVKRGIDPLTLKNNCGLKVDSNVELDSSGRLLIAVPIAEKHDKKVVATVTLRQKGLNEISPSIKEAFPGLIGLGGGLCPVWEYVRNALPAVIFVNGPKDGVISTIVKEGRAGWLGLDRGGWLEYADDKDTSLEWCAGKGLLLIYPGSSLKLFWGTKMRFIMEYSQGNLTPASGTVGGLGSSFATIRRSGHGAGS